MPALARRLIAPAALLALVAAIYLQVRAHAFLLNWDDLAYVVENETIRGLSWEHLRAAFAAPYFHNYAPLHLLSYALDHALWGLEPAGFLLTNVLLHAANGLLVLALLRRLGTSPLGAFVGAALFVVHPVQVESVAWISERKNLLAMTFSLGALHAFVSYRRAATGRARWGAYAGSLALACGALLTKAAAVVLPPLLVLLDLGWFDPSRRRRWIADKLPFAAAAVALALATVASQGDAIAEGRQAFEMAPLTTVYTMVPIVARYVGMLFWPAGLSAMYTPEIREAPDAAFAAAALLLVALAGLGVLLWGRDRRAACWYAAFFVGLVPVLHVVPLPTLMNDRYLYFPMLGVAGLAGLAVDRLARAGTAPRRAALAVGAAAIGLLAIAAHARTAVWRDDVALWRDVTEKTPRATLAWVGLGMAHADAGRLPEAIAAYQRALVEDPFYAPALNNLGGAYNQLGRPVEARGFLVRALQVDPANFNAQMNLGVSCAMTGDLACAEGAFSAAASLRPGAPEPLAELRSIALAREQARGRAE